MVSIVFGCIPEASGTPPSINDRIPAIRPIRQAMRVRFTRFLC
jgi:hypothetical protein